MKNKFSEQYKAIRQTISENIATIKRLIEQSDSLKQIAESITESDSEVKAQLEEQVGNIQGTISELIDQTEKLFKLYDDLMEDIF